MKIAVTGASGHIGTNLCRMLTDQGHQVKALIHHTTRGLTELPVDFIKGDIANADDIETLCRGCEVLIHLAACISIKKNDPQCLAMNAENCLNVIQSARRKGVRRIIHFSSIHAFRQDPLNKVLDESRELSLRSFYSYDRSKALGQKIMLGASSEDLEIIVLNPTAVIGPNDYRPSLLGNALIRFYKGQNPGLIPGGYNWVDVRDVCSAAIHAIDHGIPGECYLIGGSWQSLKTLIHEMQQYGGHKPPKLELPMWIAQASSVFLNMHAILAHKTPLYTSASLHTLKNSHQNISSEKARDALQYNPRPFSETISDTIKWFKDNKYL
jgi:dihydroflavonol-4-reductase